MASPMIMNVSTKVVNGVTMRGAVVSQTQSQKLMENVMLEWETGLELPMGQTYIKSGEYVIHSMLKKQSRWQIQLNPNYTDPQTTEPHLSVYLTLLELPQRVKEVGVLYSVCLLDKSSYPPKVVHQKNEGIIMFSKEHPTWGISKFLPISKLGPGWKNNEKLNFTVEVHFLNDVTSQPHVAVNDQNQIVGPLPSYFKDDDLKFDGHIQGGGTNNWHVEIQRIRYFTPYFDKYIVPIVPDSKRQGKASGDKENPDLLKDELFRNSKPLVSKVIEFCHRGRLEPIPKRIGGLMNLCRVGAVANIAPLKKICQQEILAKHVNVENFVILVAATKEGTLDKNPAYKILYEFAVENLTELKQNGKYRETYPEHKDFYAQLLYYNEVELREEETSGSDDDDVTMGDAD